MAQTKITTNSLADAAVTSAKLANSISIGTLSVTGNHTVTGTFRTTGNIGINTAPTTYNIDGVGATESGFRFTTGTRQVRINCYSGDHCYFTSLGSPFHVGTSDNQPVYFKSNAQIRGVLLGDGGWVLSPGIFDFSGNVRAQIQTKAANDKGLSIKGFAGQTANLLDVINSSGSVIASVNSAGAVTASSVVSNGALYVAGNTTIGGTTVATGKITANGQGSLSALGNNDVLTKGLLKEGYGEQYLLTLTENLSSASTAWVEGPTLTLPAGDYEFEIHFVCYTTSNTAGIGGFNAGLKSSNTTDNSSFTEIRTNNLTESGSNVAPGSFVRVGANMLGQAFVTAACYCDAQKKAASVITKGSTTLAATTVLNPRIQQRAGTDAANPASILKGSYLKFIKR